MNYSSERIFSTKEILDVLKRNKKWVSIFTILSGVVFAIISLFLPDYYESEVILYPASSSSISQSLLDKNVKSRDILKFGEEEEVEQVQQILQSDLIRSRIIDRFNLAKHYKIDNQSKYQKAELYDAYDENVTIRRTKYNSVKITVIDQNRDTAALIANEISNLLDTTMNFLQKTRALKAFQIVEKEYNKLQEEINFLNDSLSKLRALGINDYESQSEVFNQALAQAILKNDKNAIRELEQKIKILSEYGSSYIQLSNYLEFQTEELSIIHSKYAEAKVDLEQNLPHKFVVSAAFPAEKPSYPIRWLIVLAGMFSTLVLLTFILLIFEK
ncbi:MAG: hypothetical protein JXR60_00025 [Bacteroidales bacterium]|nr:hypothetical protein [Bacteroidales bacterium]